MGGSTNTVLHLLAAAQEGEVPFTMADIDRLSRRVPHLCKVAPSSATVHVEDVHRAGGILAIMAELDRAGLVHRDVPTVHAATLGDAIDTWDVMGPRRAAVDEFYRAAPGGVRTAEPFSQRTRYAALDVDRERGAIRRLEHAFSLDGGLAVLFGNIAGEGSIVKTAGVDPASLVFRGRARIFESQDAAVDAILGDRIVPGDVVVIRYEGPRGGPGMQEMLYPTSYLKAKGLGKSCALITDGRFSGGSSGLSIGHISPEAAEGGAIGLLEEGDVIEIDVPGRILRAAVTSAELDARRRRMEARGDEAWKPGPRRRHVSRALQAYAAMTTSASRGAVRDLRNLRRVAEREPASTIG
jgi:dihydroxy-acid dehydratase